MDGQTRMARELKCTVAAQLTPNETQAIAAFYANGAKIGVERP